MYWETYIDTVSLLIQKTFILISVIQSPNPKLPAFLQMLKRYDPKRKFSNPFLERNVFNS